MKQSNNFELLLYIIFWIGSISYAIYAVIISANAYFLSNEFEDTYNDFSIGWSFINRPIDISDNEWGYIKSVIFELLPWLLIQTIVGEILRQSNNKQFLIYWYTVISLLYISSNFGLKVLLYFLFQPVLGYFVVQFKSKIVVWLYFSICLIILTYSKRLFKELYNLHNNLEFVTSVGSFWVNIRSLNYFLYAVNEPEFRKISIKNVVTSISYCLYLPMLIIGPLVLFTDFKTVFNSSKTKDLLSRILELTKNLLRYTFWLLFTEFLLHYVYTNALSFNPQVIKNIDSWAFYGLGYCMGQYFQLKYVVSYGLSTSLAKFEGIPVPSTPKCIGRIHLYSDMWKYFDRGLYLFLLRCIYIPISGEKKTVPKKLLASSMCFLFVYAWHGIHKFVAVWSLLNFIGIAIETLAYEISQTNFVKHKIKKNMSDVAYRRLKCMIATPLFAMSAISNFYFFAGMEVGNLYMERFLTGSYVAMNVLIILYFGSQVSTEIKLREDKKVL